MDVKKALGAAVVESIDLKKLANAILDNVIEEAIKKVVADTANPIDDVAVAALWPVIEKQAKALIEEKLDLKTILGIA